MDFETALKYYNDKNYYNLSDNLEFYLSNQFCRRKDSKYKDFCNTFFKYINFTSIEKEKLKDKQKRLYEYIQSNQSKDSIIQFLKEQNIRKSLICFSDDQKKNILEELQNIDIPTDSFCSISSINKDIFNDVNKIQRYEDLDKCFPKFYEKLKDYIIWTYFNTQTTRIIEDIFRKNTNVTPLYPDIQHGTDFIIDKFPIDLKITINNPNGYNGNSDADLIKFYFENQGDVRFGTENRLFLLLNAPMDRINKIKEIEETINNFANNFKKNNFLEIEFLYKKVNYKARGFILRVG